MAEGGGGGKWIAIILGCLGVILLAIALACGGVFYGAFWAAGKAAEFAKAMERFAQRQQQIQARYVGLEGAFPFEEPAEAAVSAERLDAYLEIRADVDSAARSNRLLKAEIDGQKTDPSIGEVFELFDHLATLAETHIAQLEKHEMSKSEYDYITRAVYATWREERPHVNLPPVGALSEETVALLEARADQIEALGGSSLDGLLMRSVEEPDWTELESEVDASGPTPLDEPEEE